MSNMVVTELMKIEDVLAKEGKYVGPTVGVSMLPMLKQRRDTIVVLPKTERLKPLDVALYIRNDKGFNLSVFFSITTTSRPLIIIGRILTPMVVPINLPSFCSNSFILNFLSSIITTC